MDVLVYDFGAIAQGKVISFLPFFLAWILGD